MRWLKAVGDDQIDVSAEQGITRVPEHPLRFVVDLDDPPVAVDHEDGIRSRVDQAAKVAFAAIPPFDLGAETLTCVGEFRCALGDTILELRSCGSECGDRPPSRVI